MKPKKKKILYATFLFITVLMFLHSWRGYVDPTQVDANYAHKHDRHHHQLHHHHVYHHSNTVLKPTEASRQALGLALVIGVTKDGYSSQTNKT